MTDRAIKEAFEYFTRNERWGTCGDCPQDGNGKKLPELCQYTKRNDHQLDIDSLVEQYKRMKSRDQIKG